jgi:hypothetical protein
VKNDTIKKGTRVRTRIWEQTRVGNPFYTLQAGTVVIRDDEELVLFLDTPWRKNGQDRFYITRPISEVEIIPAKAREFPKGARLTRAAVELTPAVREVLEEKGLL